MKFAIMQYFTAARPASTRSTRSCRSRTAKRRNLYMFRFQPATNDVTVERMARRGQARRCSTLQRASSTSRVRRGSNRCSAPTWGSSRPGSPSAIRRHAERSRRAGDHRGREQATERVGRYDCVVHLELLDAGARQDRRRDAAADHARPRRGANGWDEGLRPGGAQARRVGARDAERRDVGHREGHQPGTAGGEAREEGGARDDEGWQVDDHVPARAEDGGREFETGAERTVAIYDGITMGATRSSSARR